MKRPQEVMEILEAYDLTGSFRQARRGRVRSQDGGALGRGA
jgi:hypothetical protein